MIGLAESCVFDKQSPLPGLCPPPAVARRRGLLLPKLRRQVAEFLQHGSLKRLGMLYLSTCVGLGYGPVRGLFPGTIRPPARSVARGRCTSSVTTRGPGNVNPVPIVCGFRPGLRGRLTLRGLTLRRNPWTFGGEGFHLPGRYSCQHSRFRVLDALSRVALHRRTERSATATPPINRDIARGFGVWFETRYIFGAGRLKI